MFDKLESIEKRYLEVLDELGQPDAAGDQNRFKKLMKEQSDLSPIVEAFRKYKNAKKTIEDSLEILDTENDEELKELAILSRFYNFEGQTVKLGADIVYIGNC